MPQLDLTFYAGQFFWTILIFLLCYLTVAKRFFSKYQKIVSVRKNKIHVLLDKSKSIMHEICSIEKEIRELDNKNLELIEIERREVAQKIGELQKNNASEINKELLKKDRLYTKKLMDVESELISCLESRSKEIKDNLLKFFSK